MLGPPLPIQIISERCIELKQLQNYRKCIYIYMYNKSSTVKQFQNNNEKKKQKISQVGLNLNTKLNVKVFHF